MRCPRCNTELENKNNGLEALTLTCPNCKTELIKCLSGLVPKDRFRELKKEYNG